MSFMKAYDEFIDVLATGPAAEQIIRFRASEETQRRVSDLLDREKNASLTPEETSELDRFMQFEHVVGLAKARAHLYLQQQQTSVGSRE